ncbi:MULTISPECIES: GNAT family acetyltransferase [unclassified Pseudomonas]|uniref:GNAT family acetyltransferase n=1 Tax=unclassified Pseudomonas TaxID=196821 RepID=UPI000C88BC5B|nr:MULTISPECIES: GNAT family acetyltransferase [unclassified Pseudomonas]PMZ99415.1 GNAT family acetyltransferase [Pseudomonas sp. FW305-42]PNA23196.1 GNAT family acetyltransferase [Pseudomonas sp. MPR-R1B]PNB25800.1 GNAT family acetyltransferase [Pseudomonas sp. DP16D-E2]PNB41796.1 GNAT family acetyltransferase [Pseudomonas sp. FW305-17]PNB60791.1 GNAT family acetyltransferase [Pseudomonas sp. GW531-E2]
MEIRLLHGAAIAPYIDDLANLRLTLLREYPYLLDSSLSHQADHLASYAESGRSLVVLALDGNQVVGAATGLPLVDADHELQQPFIAQGRDPASVYYFGESVLLPAYRGQGLGVRFFIERESYAHKLVEFDTCAFCTVERPTGHPQRPVDYKPLQGFWRNRGFLHEPSIRTLYRWRDQHEQASSAKILSFWLKALPA